MDVSSVTLEGITRALERVDTAAARIAAGPPEPSDIVELSQAGVQVAAAVKAMRVSDEMERRLVDLIG
jgi:hypothetical protein